MIFSGERARAYKPLPLPASLNSGKKKPAETAGFFVARGWAYKTDFTAARASSTMLSGATPKIRMVAHKA